MKGRIFVVSSAAMASLFKGSRCQSLRHRLMAHGNLRSCLSRHQSYNGNVFWYYPSFTGSRVLVVFDPLVAAGILKEESWIFCKALEPWHNRQRSQDPYERLLGDGLLLADGNHHKKRSAQFVRRLENPNLWQALQQRLLQHCNQYLFEIHNFDANSVISLLIRDVLDVYADISLDELQLEQLFRVLELAWSSNQKQQACPFRLKKRHSNRATLRSIDEVRALLVHQIDERHKLQQRFPPQLPVSISSKADADEVLLITISLAHKLSTLLIGAIDYINHLDTAMQQQLFAEGAAPLEEPTVEALALRCPVTLQELHNFLAGYDSPVHLIKRIAVCDALIRGVHVPETTEIWIPTWMTENRLPFGEGRYSCKGEDFSLAIAARLMQWLSRH